MYFRRRIMPITNCLTEVILCHAHQRRRLTLLAQYDLNLMFPSDLCAQGIYETVTDTINNLLNY
jgi:hypothetical protein